MFESLESYHFSVKVNEATTDSSFSDDVKTNYVLQNWSKMKR
jgi:hypothetical protein